MLRTLTRPKYRDLVVCAALLCAAAALVLYPGQSMEAGREGLTLCFNVIIPSLFPFFVLSSLVVELGMAQYPGKVLERVMLPLFRVGGPCASALILGFVGGYPVGARTAINLYKSGQCSRTEAERLLAFCNNSGPAFILGVVGTGVFASGNIGLLLYLAHMAASLCVGLLFRFYKWQEQPTSRTRAGRTQFQTARFSAAFTASISNSLQSVLSICAFVLFFSVIIRLLSLSGALALGAGILDRLLAPLALSPGRAEQLLIGMLEISSGVASLTGTGALAGRVSAAAFMLGWAGLSVHCQVLSFLGDSGLSVRTYLAGKAIHGVLSAAFVAVLTRLFPLSEPVSSYLSQQVDSLADLEFGRALTFSAAAAWLLWLAFFALTLYAVRKSRYFSKKRSGNGRRVAL